jgi:hypothetical protein
MCPAVLQPASVAAWQQRVYQWAFQQAQAVVRPTIMDRFQAALAN